MYSKRAVMETNNSAVKPDPTADVGVLYLQFNLVSDSTREIFQWIFFAVLSEIISSFGTVANTINIICFLKTGFKDVVNISLLGLSVSDLGCLVPLLWTNICYNPAFNRLDLPFEPIEFQYLTGAWLHVMFTRITSCITALITLERCLCVTAPLKVKTIFTHKRVKIIIFIIFIVLIVNVIPVYYVNRLSSRFSNTRNKTLIALVFTSDREQVESIMFSISNVFVQFGAFGTILVCTVILVVNLRIKSQWRKAAIGSMQQENVTSRDNKITKMVIFISGVFIACFLPVCLIIIGMIVEPEFSIGGKHRNLFISSCSIGFVLESANSSMNVFIYYRMSTKYRTVFRQLFGFTAIKSSNQGNKMSKSDQNKYNLCNWILR